MLSTLIFLKHKVLVSGIIENKSTNHNFCFYKNICFFVKVDFIK